MKQKSKLILLVGALFALGIYSCSKYEDPPKSDGDDRLTDEYCNDSRATNYNWGFPGKPNNAVCIYAVDSFLGTWLFTDSIFQPSGDTIGVEQKLLTFVATEDTTITHFAVSGWCGSPFYMTADRYSVATVDTLVEGSPGQFLCGSSSDTISGRINMIRDTAIAAPGTMQLSFTISNAAGTRYHRGHAIKQ